MIFHIAHRCSSFFIFHLFFAFHRYYHFIHFISSEFTVQMQSQKLYYYYYYKNNVNIFRMSGLKLHYFIVCIIIFKGSSCEKIKMWVWCWTFIAWHIKYKSCETYSCARLQMISQLDFQFCRINSNRFESKMNIRVNI